MRQTRPEPGAGWVLFAASGTAATATALANALVLAHAGGIVRLRDLRFVARLRYFIDAHAPTLLHALPAILHVPFDLGGAAPRAAFVALAIGVHLALVWTVAALLAPLALPIARQTDVGRWRRGYPFAIAVAALTPIVAHRLSLWTSAGAGAIWTMAGAIATGAWWVAVRVVPSRAAALLFVRFCGVATVAALAAVGAGTVALLASTGRAGADRAPPPSGSPNVLLISIDTLRPDHLGSYGYARPTSPSIDALAAAGARFTTAVSPTSWTLPAHMTLLTGLPPEVHGVVSDGLRLDPATVTLAEVLHARGYETAGVVSGPYLDAGYGFARGFDRYDDWSAVRISQPATHQAHTSPAVLAAVEAWLDGPPGNAPVRPFFLFVHLWDVHYDFNPPPPYDTLFDPDYVGTVTGLDFETGDAVHAGMPARDLAHVVALYDGEIRYTDEYVGRVIEALRTRKLLDTTVVVVTADHGEEFFEHGRKGHRNALYDESIRVPLIVRYPPRVAAGTVVDRQVRLIDVPATILALTETPAPPTFGLPAALAPYAGRSLVPLMSTTMSPTTSTTDDAPIPPLPAFADLATHALSAVRHDDAKLIDAPFAAVPHELYDLAHDPGERTNLAGSRPDALGDLQHELATWRDTARLAARHAAAASMSEDHKAALRALGYVE